MYYKLERNVTVEEIMEDEAIDSLVNLVRRHYATAREPLYLSQLGTKLGDGRSFLVNKYGSLGKAVKSLGASTLELVNEENPGSIAVVTPEVKDEMAAYLSKDNSTAAAKFDELPFPIRVAFCLRTEQGQSVAVRTTAPIRYQRLEADEAVPPGFITIDLKYRQPGVDLRELSLREKAALWKTFLEWAEATRVDPEILMKGSSPSNALERLLAAQTPDVLERMSLPADIVSILIRHS